MRWRCESDGVARFTRFLGIWWLPVFAALRHFCAEKAWQERLPGCLFGAYLSENTGFSAEAEPSLEVLILLA